MFNRVATHSNWTKKVPDFLLTVKQFLQTMQDDYYGHEQTKIRMTQ